MSGQPVVPDGCPLTPTQRLVLSCIAEGSGRDEISRRLSIAVSTVNVHCHRIRRRLGTPNIGDAVRIMVENGWAVQVDHDDAPLPPALAEYLKHFEASRWPHEPDERSERGMALALAGHRNTMTTPS